MGEHVAINSKEIGYIAALEDESGQRTITDSEYPKLRNMDQIGYMVI